MHKSYCLTLLFLCLPYVVVIGQPSLQTQTDYFRTLVDTPRSGTSGITAQGKTRITVVQSDPVPPITSQNAFVPATPTAQKPRPEGGLYKNGHNICLFLITELSVGWETQEGNFLEMGMMCPTGITCPKSVSNPVVIQIDLQMDTVLDVQSLEGKDLKAVDGGHFLCGVITLGIGGDLMQHATLPRSVQQGPTLLILLDIKSYNTLKWPVLKRLEGFTGQKITGTLRTALKDLNTDWVVYANSCDETCVGNIKSFYPKFVDDDMFPNSAIATTKVEGANSMSRCSDIIARSLHSAFQGTPPTPNQPNLCSVVYEFPYTFNNVVLRSHARKLVVNLGHCFKKMGQPKHQVQRGLSVNEGVAECLNLSPANVKNIVKVHSSGSELVTPKGRKPKTGSVRSQITSFEVDHIWRIVVDCFRNNKAPTAAYVHQQFFLHRENMKCSLKTFRKILRSLNYRYKRIDRRAVLVQRQEVVILRQKYLLKYLNNENLGEEEKSDLVFLDETWIDMNMRIGKAWMPRQILNHKTASLFTYAREQGTSAPRLVVLAAVSEQGIIKENVKVYSINKNKKTDDYHDNVNHEIFTDWFTGLLQTLKRRKLQRNRNQIIVIDNAPYHSSSTAPLLNAKKAVLQEFLIREQQKLAGRLGQDPTRTIMGMKLLQLKPLVRELKKKNNYYAIDALAAENGFTVWRQPPWHPDLNPIELVWNDVKRNVRERNVDLNANTLQRLTTQLLQDYPAEEAKKKFEKVKRTCLQRIAEQYDKEDGKYKQHKPIDPIVIDVDAEEADMDDDDGFEPEEMPPLLTLPSIYDEDEPNEDHYPDAPPLDDYSLAVANQNEAELAMKLTYDLFHGQDNDVQLPAERQPKTKRRKLNFNNISG